MHSKGVGVALNFHHKFKYVACTALAFICLGLTQISRLNAAEANLDVIDRARASQAMEIQLLTADLLDELVFQWISAPPAPGAKSRVALIKLSVPIGINNSLTAFLENHLFDLLTKNPQTGLVPVYCGPCVATTAYSTSKSTVIAKGADIPELATELKDRADFGLYIDFEAIGSELIMRSYLTDLQGNRILSAKTLVTDTGHPPLLREAKNLRSSADTRQSYLEILEGKRRWSVSAAIRFTILNVTSTEVASVPFAWALIGIETSSDPAKKWILDLQYGAASLPDQYNATLLSSRVYRHIAADTLDLVAPNTYYYVGVEYLDIKGPGALVFMEKDRLTPGVIAATARNSKVTPRTHAPAIFIGIETRINDFMRLGVFAENYLNQQSNDNFPKNTYHSYGFEMGVSL